MAMHTDLPIHKVAFDLLSLATDVTRNIPRDFKAGLGAKVRDECIRDLKGGSFGCCVVCGTAKHKDGWFWLAGIRSKQEPPCHQGHPMTTPAFAEWMKQAENMYPPEAFLS